MDLPVDSIQTAIGQIGEAMKRDLERLQKTRFDMAVIGAGVHGAVISALGAACGLRTVLLERGDFCSGTSANSLKILHGGLRYLQHMDFPRIRDSVASRRWMLHNFPELVRPLQCIMPTRGRGVRSREAMTVGLLLNDLFSCTRNRGVLPSHHLGRGKILSVAACRKIISGLEQESTTGGACWYDALAENTERIILELVVLLTQRGGDAANYVAVDGIVQEGTTTTLACRDRETGASLTLHAGCVVNSTGPGLTQFAPLQAASAESKGWSRAVNLVVGRQLFPTYAVGLEGSSSFVDHDAVIQKGKRLFFFVPWRGRTMIGTVYTPHADPRVAATVTRKDLEDMIKEINQIYPAGKLRFEDIATFHVGVMPSIAGEGGGPYDVQLDKRELIVDHGKEDSLPNVYSVKTVKYTTAFTMACRLFQQLADGGILKKADWEKAVASPFAAAPGREQVQELPAYLRRRYGRQALAVVPYLSGQGNAGTANGTAEQLDPGEIRYAVEQEMALHLDDVLLRRTGIATASQPSDETLEMAADVMTTLLGWSPQQRTAELERVYRYFAPLQH